ncbi:early nodulin-like protein 9 [Alnus glutinosa]|uniref:early nodulin-like protein 9 n=1 Tax=Alnus glutinosa TaxID=3517 RepID=UPI002D7769EA|nr:early nodulin-like protein 9 [Alnus glutinosa]
MANSIFRSNDHHQNKTLHVVVGLFCLMMLVHKGGATEFTVGGSKGWTVPDPELHYNQWAENNRFQKGDSLVFVYPPDQDSVLHVTPEAYNNCTTTDPMEKFSDGHTVYTLQQTGAFYFISGDRDRCVKNEKLVLVVLADRSNGSKTNETSTPPPPPTGETPSPAPSGEESPPPATPSPISEIPPPPPSGASSISISFIGFLGALTAASPLLFLS